MNAAWPRPVAAVAGAGVGLPAPKRGSGAAAPARSTGGLPTAQRWFMALVGIALLLPAGAGGQPSVRRFLLAIGANNGGSDRDLLRYAISDATSFAAVFAELGGVDPADQILLRDPDLAGCRRGLDDLQQRVAAASRWGGGPCEVIFYYSGHADAEGLLVGGECFPYAEVRQALMQVPAVVRIAVLDACASGTITRLKGGRRQPPFLAANGSDVRGYAFITSSSADEASQESARVAGSYFTHHLVSGLRGAADQSGDGRVSLDEAYRHAYDQTLAQTAGTRGGVQHPTRDIAMVGSGDLVMTDLRHMGAGVVLAPSLAGRVYVQDSDQRLAVELRKAAGKAAAIGLAPGRYWIRVGTDSLWSGTALVLAAGDRRELAATDLQPLKAEPTTRRGNLDPTVHLVAGEGPNLDIVTRQGYRLSLSLFFSDLQEPFRGLQAAWLVNQSSASAGSQLSLFGNLGQAELRGWQATGMVNWSVGPLQGGQVSGGVNIARQVRGWQVANSTNIAKHMRGWQVALMTNMAKEIRGGQVGALNGARIVDGPQVGELNIARQVRGWQAGAGINLARQVNGGQAGVVNLAGTVQGWQVGLVNLAGDLQGTPVGLVNYARNGLLALQGGYDECGVAEVSLASGGRHVYTAFSVGQRPDAPDPVLTLGLAAGGYRPTGHGFAQIEAGVQRLFHDWHAKAGANTAVRLRFLWGQRVRGAWSVYAGASGNVLFRGQAAALVEPWGGRPWSFGGDRYLAWPGLGVGLRFGRR